jgi:hypothetical protein
MSSTASAERLAQQAKFVFKGTVRKVKAATMDEVKPDDRTAIVLVDEIVHAPAPFANYVGKEITVQVGGRKKIQQGQQAVFFANGWRFGKSIAVRSIDHLSPVKIPSLAPNLAVAATAGHGLSVPRPAPAQRLSDRELQRQVETADLVLTGRVTSVRAAAEMLKTAKATGGKASGVGQGLPRISEHDPLWCEAVLEVLDVEKGAGAVKQVVVRFPSSTDVRWHRAPKFHPGQEGVFILRNAEAGSATTGKRAALGPKSAPAVYLVAHSADFQPINRVEQIRSFIASSGQQGGS